MEISATTRGRYHIHPTTYGREQYIHGGNYLGVCRTATKLSRNRASVTVTVVTTPHSHHFTISLWCFCHRGARRYWESSGIFFGFSPSLRTSGFMRYQSSFLELSRSPGRLRYFARVRFTPLPTSCLGRDLWCNVL